MRSAPMTEEQHRENCHCAREQGHIAGLTNDPINPYDSGSDMWSAWWDGFNFAKESHS